MRPTNPTVIVTAEPLLAGIILYLAQCSEIKLIRNKTLSKKQIFDPYITLARMDGLKSLQNGQKTRPKNF